MRSAAFRLTIGAAAWIAIGVAALLLVRSERQIRDLADDVRVFDRYAREATDAVVDVRLAQQAYVAAGQGTAYWLDKATVSAAAVDAALASLRASASPAALSPIDEAASAEKAFAAIDARVREYLKTGQQLMAGDVIFSEGSDAAASVARQIDAARQAEHQALDATVAVMRRQQAILLTTGAAVVALAVLILVPTPRRREQPAAEETFRSIAPYQPEPVAAAVPPPPVSSPAADAIKGAAALATDIGRVRDLDELRRVLGRAAELMDASGVMVWMGAPGGADLRPVLAHGYSADMLDRIPPVPRSANNAAAAAFRSGTLQIVLSRPGGSPGAVVAPILSSDGCVGALSAEIRHGGETSETTQGLASILAAQLANVVAQTPAEVSEAKAM